jgi:hypothetical protein
MDVAWLSLSPFQAAMAVEQYVCIVSQDWTNGGKI